MYPKGSKSKRVPSTPVTNTRKNWKKYYTEEGRGYYYNEETGEATPRDILLKSADQTMLTETKGLIYQITTVKNIFSEGQFTQQLEGLLVDFPNPATVEVDTSIEQTVKNQIKKVKSDVDAVKDNVSSLLTNSRGFLSDD